ncbi:hypothetical protein BJX61DRAFT_148570 [Aspergillus egyptiacus]|nr:hypothetical protein BJX61DRAFT_148570 [Aspergillus egyptiacus]
MVRQAIQSTTDGHLHRPVWLKSLGTKLASRYKNKHNILDLAEAIVVERKAIQALPPNDWSRVGWLEELTVKLQQFKDLKGTPVSPQKARKLNNATAGADGQGM